MIAVFFTHGVSLELWDKRGMFSREVRFYQELARRVGDVSFFTYGENDERYRDRLGSRIRLFPKRCKCPPSHYALMLPFVHRKQLRQAYAIRIHQVAGAIPALLAHWLYRKPLVVRAGFQWYRFAKQQGASRVKLAMISLMECLAYRSAHTIIHTTNEDANFVAKQYGIDRKKILVIPNYVDTELFRPISQTIDGVPRPRPNRSICFVGRLEPQKNLMALLEAMQGLDARLVVYGEGSQRNELATRANALCVRADFRGRIANDELPAALNACDIFVLPSLYEGNPKVLLEAMACGLAVVGTNVEGIASVIEEGKTGLLCDTDPNSIREAIQKLLNDPPLRAHLGAAARKMIAMTQSLPQTIEHELDILHALHL